MKKLFKIDENWSVVRDENNSILTKTEIKQRKNKEGLVEDYTAKTEFFYPNLHTALKKYLLLTLDEAIDVKNCVGLIDKALKQIDEKVIL